MKSLKEKWRDCWNLSYKFIVMMPNTFIVNGSLMWPNLFFNFSQENFISLSKLEKKKDDKKSKTDVIEDYLPNHNESIFIFVDKFVAMESDTLEVVPF